MKDRRTFLKTMAALTAGAMVPFRDLHGNVISQGDKFGDVLPLRLLGKTGEKVTMLGLGGAHIAGVMDETTAQAVIERAIEGGIRFFDAAYDYGEGLSEERYGRYLVPKYRDVSFIMTKSTAKDGEAALKELEQSLKRLNVEYVDLWQIHGLGSPKDVDARIDHGVLEAFRKAKESGKVRYIGFTGHADFNAHNRMLEQTDVLETCQCPINCFDPNYKSFIRNFLPKAVDRKMGILAMKTLSNGGFFGGTKHFHGGDNPRVVPNVVSIQEALHFVWSLPVSVALTGAHDVEMLQEKIDVAKSFRKMDEPSRLALVERVGNAGLEGSKVEFYKA